VRTLKLIVYGSPAPQGSKKFLGTFTGRDGRVHAKLGESSAKVKPWRQDVKAAAEELRGVSNPIDAPLAVRMVFTVPKPASSPKRRRVYPMRKPDISKLCRSTEDALVDAGLIADDARIVEYTRLAKVFPGEDAEALNSSGVRIEIRIFEDSIAPRPAASAPSDLFEART
jgi:Holliday junction resolvase RusA-like endonuclease